MAAVKNFTWPGETLIFWEKLIGNALGATLRAIFSEVHYFAKVTKFRPRRYSLVMAIHELGDPPRLGDA